MAVPNVLAMAKIFQASLDKQVLAESVTGYMEPNASRIRYNGGDTVNLPRLSTDALANYNRTTGHVAGAATLVWDPYQLTQDRGRSFQIDTMDVDESAFVVTAGNVMGEFQRLQVVPEIDAYRLSKISATATVAGYKTSTADASLPANLWLDALLDDIAAVRDRIGETASLNIHMSAITRRKLSQSTRAVDFFGSATFNNGNLTTELETIDRAFIRITSQALLQSNITISATNGWAPAAGAIPLRWLIVSTAAPIAVSKTDVPRIFDPMTNQAANAWKVDYRKFHDLWVPTNQRVGLHVNAPGI